MASPTPCGYSPGVRPADLAGRSLSPAEAGRELGQGQPPLPWLGCAPGAGLHCPGGVSPRGRPPLPWWGVPPGQASAALVGCPPGGPAVCGWQPVLAALRPRLPGGGLTAVTLLPGGCVRLSPPRRDPSRTPRRLCPGLQSRALKASQDAGSLTFTKCPCEQPLREQGAPGGGRVSVARGGLSLPSSPAGHPEGKSGLERVRLDKRRGRNVGLT